MVSRNGLLIAEKFDSLLHLNNLDSIDLLFADDLGERLDKPGLATWRQRRRVILHDSDGPSCLYIKRFDSPPSSAQRQVRRAGNAARSVAGVEFNWIQRLEKCGIPCPRVVAFGEEFHDGTALRSVLVTQAVPGQSLEKWMPQWHEVPSGQRRDVLLGVARLVSRLHGQGYVHRDLYLSHVFFDPPKTGQQALCLIDLQRVHRPRRMTRWIIKDLAALHYSAPTSRVSRCDRLRWLLAYLEATKLDTRGKRWAYRVIGKTARIARKESRRGRQES